MRCPKLTLWRNAWYVAPKAEQMPSNYDQQQHEDEAREAEQRQTALSNQLKETEDKIAAVRWWLEKRSLEPPPADPADCIVRALVFLVAGSAVELVLVARQPEYSLWWLPFNAVLIVMVLRNLVSAIAGAPVFSWFDYAMVALVGVVPLSLFFGVTAIAFFK